MSDVESFLEAPGDRDVPVMDVFNEDMFSKLDGRMQQVGWESVRSYWDTDFKDRKIVAGFMKDKLLGSKRLASMPDRIPIQSTLQRQSRTGGGGHLPQRAQTPLVKSSNYEQVA
mmetsp:Transcript_10023/g.14362  ORF Transcript_10023/g.14362 Transcript_10023/m.14362 type:complete len:114 (+) Transcript_10023:264-605(+)